MHTYIFHLGSNIGEKKLFLEKAILQIGEKIGTIEEKSMMYETEPWGLKEQENFLNMALKVRSQKDYKEVFATTKEIEKQIGSTKVTKWGPRILDIDIIYCDDLVIQSDELTIPHPRMYDRNFVLIPLIEIAGEFVDPVKKLTVDELYDQCTDNSDVFIYEE